MNNIILVVFVIAIVVIQIYLFKRTGKLIHKLKQVLSYDFKTTLLRDSTDEKYVTMIRCTEEYKDYVTETIEKSINLYLQKNKGAVSDFNLIKDIVERNCDTLESEISSQTPLPLYLGLMGTVAGIILGLFTIKLNGGFSNIENVIEILMGDVAIAMIASFMGIGFTTWTLWKSKECKVRIEDNKNSFYTWIQTNLLPVLSQSAVSAITLLQKNLTHFNESFTGTIDRLDAKLTNVGDLYESQIEILEKIEAIDIKKMASANVKVLTALDGSMGSLERFQQYMSDVTEYLTAVKDLNQKLDDHLERTEALGVVSDFYKSQMNEIHIRQDAIRTAVVAVDDVMKSTLASLKSNSEEGLRSMQEAFVSQLATMQKTVAEQTENLTSQLNQMPQIIKKLDVISEIPTKLDKLINRIEKSNSSLAKELTSKKKSGDVTLPNTFRDVEATRSNNERSTFMRWSIVIILAIIALACIANLSVNIINAPKQNLENIKDHPNLIMESVRMDTTANSDSVIWSRQAENAELMSHDSLE